MPIGLNSVHIFVAVKKRTVNLSSIQNINKIVRKSVDVNNTIPRTIPLDKETQENWRKVKEALEAAGKTDSFFYVRSLAILKGEKDPLDVTPNKTES